MTCSEPPCQNAGHFFTAWPPPLMSMQVNKPYLPLASGALTPGQGFGIVVASALGGTAIGEGTQNVSGLDLAGAWRPFILNVQAMCVALWHWM